MATGYIDLQARFYDPLIGPFMQVDPITEGQDEFSPYHYSFNNPLRFSDPDGRFACCNDSVDGIGNGMSLVENVYWSTRDALASSVATVGTFFGSLIGDTETQRVNASYANGKRTLSAEVVPEGEVAISGLVLATAVPSGGNAGAGLLLTTTGSKASVVGSLVRFGQKAESAEELANQAAEASDFPHGVSTKKVDQVKGSDKAHKKAKLSEVEQAFKVEQTGNKAAHHAVHSPKPVTQSVANLFNSIFKPIE